MAEARRRGLHSYAARWVAIAEVDLSTLTQLILSWSRETVAKCRRPYGIDQFDLEIVFDGDARDRKPIVFKGLRPLRLYEQGFDAELRAMVETAGSVRGRSIAISANLFSWGDAADKALAQS